MFLNAKKWLFKTLSHCAVYLKAYFEANKKSPILYVVLIALFLRLWGIGFGLPEYFFYADEWLYIRPALNIVETLDLNPHRSVHPSLFVYLQSLLIFLYGSFAKLLGSNYASIYDLPLAKIHLIGRIGSAVMGTATVYLVYRVGKEMYDSRTGLLASSIMASVFVHVQYSHYVKNDILATLLGVSSLLFSYRILKYSRDKDYLLAGLLVGLSTSAHYNGIFFAVPLAISHIHAHSGKSCRQTITAILSKGAILGTCAIVLGFVIGSPYWVLSFSEFFEKFQPHKEYTLVNYGNPMSEENGFPSWLWYLEYLWSAGVYYPIFIASVGGILLGLLRHRKTDILLLSFPAAYALFAFNFSFRTDRLSIPFTPFLALFAALAVISFFDYLNPRLRNGAYGRPIAILLLLFVIGIPFARVLAFDYTLASQDTREVAAHWMDENVQPDRLLFMLGGSPMLIGHHLRGGNFTNVINRVRIDDKDLFRFPGELAVIGMSDWRISENYRNSEYFKPEYENYLLLMEKGTLVKEIANPLYESEFFSPFRLEHSATVNNYHNPTIRIYTIPEIENISSFPIKVYYPMDMLGVTDMQNVTDPKAEGGVALFSDINQTASIRGNYEPFPRGNYSVVYSLKTDSNSINETVAWVDIRSATGKIYAEVPINGTDFSATNEYQRFELSLSLANGDIVGFRVSATGKGRLWVEKIEAVRIRVERLPSR